MDEKEPQLQFVVNGVMVCLPSIHPNQCHRVELRGLFAL